MCVCKKTTNITKNKSHGSRGDFLSLSQASLNLGVEVEQIVDKGFMILPISSLDYGKLNSQMDKVKVFLKVFLVKNNRHLDKLYTIRSLL